MPNKTGPLQLYCVACQKPSKVTKTHFTGCYSIGTVIDETSYRPIFDGDGGTHWACPDCAKKIATLARKLQKMVDPKDERCIHLNTLVRLDKGNKADEPGK